MVTKPISKQCFSRTRRVTRRSDFLRVQGRGRKYRSEHLLLCFSPRSEQSKSEILTRLGLTVTKKIDKRAARRNCLKRRLRHLFRLAQHELRCGQDLIFIALNGATELRFAELREEFFQLLKRARLLQQAKSGMKSTAGEKAK